MLQNDVIKSCLIATNQQRGEIVSRRHVSYSGVVGMLKHCSCTNGSNEPPIVVKISLPDII